MAGETILDPEDGAADPSDVWHELYLKFAIDVSSAYRDAPAIRKTLLGSYESQLAEHQAGLVKERKKAAKVAQTKAGTEPETGPGAGQTTP